MTVTIPAEPAIPDRPDPEPLAAAGLAQWLRKDQAAAEEYEEAMRADTHRREMRRRSEAASQALDEIRGRVSSLIDKHNLDGRRTLPFWLGSVIVVVLVVLDAIPLNWAAQAFDLNAADSWLVTLILLAASLGVMAGLETARQDARRYRVLVTLTLIAYIGIAAMRASFLVTVAGESAVAALLQATVLSAISAGLVFLGSAVMVRTRSLRLSRAQANARRASRASQASDVDCRRAEEKRERHLDVLRRQLMRQPLYSEVPVGLIYSEWSAALHRALRAQFAQR